MRISLCSMFVLLFGSVAIAQSVNATLLEKNFLGDGNPWSLTAIDGKVYFSAISGSDGRELWMHDSSTSETVLLKDIGEGADYGIDKTTFTKAGNNIFFIAKGTYFSSLWRTDGTTAGTYLVKQIWDLGENEIRIMNVLDDKLIFSANDGIHGSELWSSDGTANGTYMVKDIFTGNFGSNIYGSFVLNGELYFNAYNGTDQIWKTDGTAEGTIVSPNQNLNGNVIEMNGNYYYYFNELNTGYELWKTDGTLTGTQLVKDILPGPDSSSFSFIGAKLNDQIIFVAYSAETGSELWVTNGTAEGTILLKDINPNGDSVNSYDAVLTLHQGKVYFRAYNPTSGNELWSTDGTESGTILVKDIIPGPGHGAVNDLTSVNNLLFFTAKHDASVSTRPTIWATDGTSDGTVELSNIGIPGISNTEFTIVEANGSAYFQGGYGSLNGLELWKSSGTPETTSLLFDLQHSRGISPKFQFGATSEINGKLIFFAQNEEMIHIPYISDGSDNGTYPISSIGPPGAANFDNTMPLMTKAGNNLYYRGTNPETGAEIYKIDGVAETSTLLKDIAVGGVSSISEYPMFMAYNDLFLFFANDQLHGYELWRTDGTEDGTYMLKDINEGVNHAINGQSNMFKGLRGYAILNGLLYFTADNGTQTSIYKTDGTADGTQLAFNPYHSGLSDYRPTIMGATNGKLFYTTNLDNSSYGNHAIWASDGTATDNVLLGDYSSSLSTQLENCVVFNNTLYYAAYLNGYGRCLMKSDGTIAGTSIVKSNLDHNMSVRMKNMDICGDFIYFSLGDYTFDQELWRSDGTAVGTIRIDDGAAIPLSEYYSDYTCMDNHTLAYLSFQDGNTFQLTNGYPEYNQTKEIEVINGENFEDFYSLYGIGGVVGGKILFSGITGTSGDELYLTDMQSLLGLNDHAGSSMETSSVVIYPNPNAGKMTVIASLKANVTKIEVYDFLGKQITVLDYNSNSIDLDLSSCQKGLYILKIHTTGGIDLKKIVTY